VRIREDERALAAMLEASPALAHVRSLPGIGPILAAVVVTEIDTIESRYPPSNTLPDRATVLRDFILLSLQRGSPIGR
jgi:hypothetical protein